MLICVLTAKLIRRIRSAFVVIALVYIESLKTSCRSIILYMYDIQNLYHG